MRPLLLFIQLIMVSPLIGQTTIPTRSLQVAWNKTTNLIFPAPIVSIDRGSTQVLVQKSTPQVLRLKADTVFVDTTNLTVITSDGQLYSFLVSYHASPTNLTIDLSTGTYVDKDTSLMAIVDKVKKQSNNFFGVRYSHGKVKLSVIGLYSTGELLAMKLRIDNHSSLSYSVGDIRVQILSMSTTRRTPNQATVITPLLLAPHYLKVAYKQSGIVVLLIPVTAFNQQQALELTLQEASGERHLRVYLSHRFLFDATLLP